MNIRYVIRQLGLLVAVLSLSMLAVAAWSLLVYIYGGAAAAPAMDALMSSVAGGLMLALVLLWLGQGGGDHLGRREALLLVALSWLVGAGVAALPYWLWAHGHTMPESGHAFRSYVSCYFEAMSGLTTTGATVLSDIGGVPRNLLLWRAITHWLGGLGIVVMFVAVLPTLGVGGKKLFHVESPGPTNQGVRPRIRQTARVLWIIYLGLTVVQVAALLLCGMGGFDAVCHTFATLATGGFSTYDASVGRYDSVAVDVVIIVFMVLSGVNFGLYYQLYQGRYRSVWTDPELRLYLGFLLLGSAVVVAGLAFETLTTTTGTTAAATPANAVRYGVFQVVSIQTTTGFGTADFDQWGFFPKAALLGLMFIGGCAGSTGGGIKVIRCLIAYRVMLAEVDRVFRPNVVRTIKVGRMTVDPELRLATMVYVVGIIVLFLMGALLLMLFEPVDDMSFVTAASASAASLNNVGPGFAMVGPVANYGWLSSPSKIVISLLMLLGRLEVYTVFVLFIPRFWRGE